MQAPGFAKRTGFAGTTVNPFACIWWVAPVCGEKLGPRIRGMRACAVGGSCLRLSLGLWWFELDIVEVAIIDEVVAMGILGEDVA